MGNSASASDEMDFKKVISILVKHRQIVLATQISFFLTAVLYLHLVTHTYTVTLQVTPVSTETARPSGGVGALASLAGLNLSASSGETSFELYLAGYNSRDAAVALAHRSDLFTKIFSSEWDQKSQTWVNPIGPLGILKDEIKSILGISTPAWQPPSSGKLQEYLMQKVKITKNHDSPIVTISIDIADPKLGQDLLWALHQSVDNYLKKRALERATGNISYINQQLQKVTVSEYRQALIETLSQQEKSRMMASSDMSFAAEPFGPPEASLKPTKPIGGLVLFLGLLLGSLFGIFLALVKAQFRWRISF